MDFAANTFSYINIRLHLPFLECFLQFCINTAVFWILAWIKLRIVSHLKYQEKNSPKNQHYTYIYIQIPGINMLIKGQSVCCLYEGIQDPSIFTSYMSKSVVFLMLSFDFYKLANFVPSGYTEPIVGVFHSLF